MFAFLEWLTFENLIKWFKDSVLGVWNWFWGFVGPTISPLWDSVAATFTAITSKISTAIGYLDGLVPYLQFANAWAPVDVFFQLLGAYSAFWLALVIYRSVKKWIPTLSG